MLGRFLEISVACENPLAVLGDFLEFGFRELSVGDVWSHPYAVVSDGVLNVGLHGYQFDSPALTFVQNDLDRWVQAYRLQDIELAFEKLSSESFNEIGFIDPGGQMCAVLESRTFSPPPFDDDSFTVLGRFKALELPCSDRDASRAFWRKLGVDDQARLGMEGPPLHLAKTPHLTCHFHGNVLALAQQAARRGLTNVRIATDERTATVQIGELAFVVHAQPVTFER